MEEPLCPKIAVPGETVMVAPDSTNTVPWSKIPPDQVSEPVD